MSSDSLQRRIASVSRDLGSLYSKLADERNKEASKARKLGVIQASISRTTSSSQLQSKHREMIRLQADIAQSRKKQADLSRQIASKEKAKCGLELSYRKARSSELEAFERRQKQAIDGIANHVRLEVSDSVTHRNSVQETEAGMEHDVFVSHASEDKTEIVGELVKRLQSKGVDVWYDEFTLTVGDSLRRSIDKGLANSRYGIVVLSSAFFSKNWPQYELDGLVTREISSGSKVILPIWHKVSKDEVASHSPTLADKVALNTGVQSLDKIVEELLTVILAVPPSASDQ